MNATYPEEENKNEQWDSGDKENLNHTSDKMKLVFKEDNLEDGEVENMLVNIKSSEKKKMDTKSEK